MSTLLPLLTDYEKSHISERQPLPEQYIGLSDEEMDARIAAAKAKLGRRLVILGHHYQRDEVIKFADYTGDSYKLAHHVAAASRRRVHRLLRRPLHGRERRCAERRSSAGDSSRPRGRLLDVRHGGARAARDVLAANCEDIREASTRAQAGRVEAGRAGGATRARQGSAVIPVTYINSAAAIKAFCGERGGVVCTSSNAAATLKWAWERGEKVLFLPDQHLGRNTAYKMGVPLDDMVLWDPNEVWGGLDPEAVEEARASFSGRGTARCTRASPCGRSSSCARSIPASASSFTPKCRGTSFRRRTIPARPSTSFAR